MTIRCLIIDDEPSSQIILKNFIKDVDFLELSGTCNNAIEALETLQNTNIDLLFLDIKMPKISGLSFYKSLPNPPKVIFTTAYPKYAIDGFEVNAVDFLLKPFAFERFLTAVNKVLELIPNTKNLIEPEYLLIKSNKVLHKIRTENVIFIEAFGDYVKVHLKDSFILTNSTFTSILKTLPEKKFIRTHKSFAINSEKVNSIKGNQINMNSYKIPIGQKYKSNFLKFINTPT
ncbi:MAG: response regulator transcription factor [Algibacter sp.]